MQAWLLDAYVVRGAIRTWWISATGQRFSAELPFYPVLYIGPRPRAGKEAPSLDAKQNWERIADYISTQSIPTRTRYAERTHVASRQTWEVLSIQVMDPQAYAHLTRDLQQRFPWAELFNADIPVTQYGLYEWELYPTAWCELQMNEQGWITQVYATDSRRLLDPVTPVLRFLSVSMEGEDINPRHGKKGNIVLRTWESHVPDAAPETTTLVIEAEGEELLESLARYVSQADPDIILSEWGDDVLMPHLLDVENRFAVRVPWNRDTQAQVHIGQDHTYFSYGLVKHRAPIISCFGRIHIDMRNSFLHQEGDIDGLFELARLSSLPLQRLARTTIGTAMSSMQLLTAVRRGVLIPIDKRQPEDWKTAAQLIRSDKGGLVYQPLLGFHENVVELDFASLYPTIMVRYNISAETINCSCCPSAPLVPEIGYRMCQRTYGLVPETLEIIVDKRTEFKVRLRGTLSVQQRLSYERRQNVLKWILVTCFGYLGFKNARFGRIEAHESVTAYGRELLLRAKQLCEEAGFRFLHGIVDSIWLYKKEIQPDEVVTLVERIFTATRVHMKIEGQYRWIAFLPSTQDPDMPVANRYFGLFNTGEFKLRGIELRRHDTPGVVRQVQRALLDVVASCQTVAEVRAALPRARAVVEEYCEQLASGRTPFCDLAITRRVSREPQAYTNRTLGAVVAQELMGRGISISAGEMIQYVITDSQSDVAATRARALGFIDADWTYDTQAYVKLVRRAFASLFSQLEGGDSLLK